MFVICGLSLQSWCTGCLLFACIGTCVCLPTIMQFQKFPQIPSDAAPFQCLLHPESPPWAPPCTSGGPMIGAGCCLAPCPSQWAAGPMGIPSSRLRSSLTGKSVLAALSLSELISVRGANGEHKTHLKATFTTWLIPLRRVLSRCHISSPNAGFNAL